MTKVTSYLILSDISHNDSGIYHCITTNELVEVRSINSSGRVYILSKSNEGNYACSASNGIPNLIQSQEYSKAFITVQGTIYYFDNK